MYLMMSDDGKNVGLLDHHLLSLYHVLHHAIFVLVIIARGTVKLWTKYACLCRLVTKIN